MIERAKYENRTDRERVMKDYARGDYLQKNKEILVRIKIKNLNLTIKQKIV